MPNQNLNTTTTMPAENATFYDKNLLKRLLATLVWARWAQKKNAPKKKGATVSFRKFESLKPNGEPLTEGVTPDGHKMTVTEVKAIVKQYGDYIELTDVVDMVGIDPILTEATDILGEMAGMLIDDKCRDSLCSGTNVVYANAKSERALVGNSDVLTGTDVKKAVKVLKKANVKRINGYYIGIIDPDCAGDLMDDPLWRDVSKYNGGEQIMKGELGKIHGVKFFETSNAKIFEGQGADGADVHSTIILGQDAYGITDIEGSSKPKFIVKPVGSGGSEDPLDQRGSTGYKTFFTALRLQELAIVRIESGATE